MSNNKEKDTNSTTGTEVPTQTFSQMLSSQVAEKKKKIAADKTDAVKMQRYHALTDVFKSIGQMGGAAIGGAIGGGTLDSAPAVAEYQPSRGYVDAFEKAKQANERLRALEDQEFQLNLQQKQIEDERAYKDKTMQAEMDYRSKEAELNREFEIDFYAMKSDMEQAIAEKNWERTKELQLLMQKRSQQHEIDMQNLRNSGAITEALVRQETAKQNSNPAEPVIFDDNTVMNIPEDQIKAIKKAMIGKQIGGVWVNDTNVDTVFGANPQFVKERLALLTNGGASYTASATDVAQQQTATQVDASSNSKSDKNDGSGRRLFGGASGPMASTMGHKKQSKKEPDIEGDKDLGVTWITITYE